MGHEMSIQTVTEKEQQLSSMLKRCSEVLRMATQERDEALHTIKIQEAVADGNGKLIKVLRDALEAECGGRCNAEYNPCAARTALTRSKS